MSTTILILGGGTGGIMTTAGLRKKLSSKTRNGEVKIILFEKEKDNVFAPSLLWLMVGKRKSGQVFRKTSFIKRKGIEVVQGDIESINPADKSITVNGKTYNGDYVVVSLGTDYTTEHNLDKFGCDFFTLIGANAFYEKLQMFNAGKIIILISSLPFKCPAAPYEAAMLIENFIRKKGIRDKTEISLYTPETLPMPVAGKELGSTVQMMLEQKGIRYFPQHQLQNAAENTLTFISTGGSEIAEYDLLAYTPEHQCPSVLKTTALVGKSGWVEVNRNTMETNFPNVYAIGDNTFIPLEMGKPLPKAGVFAHYQAQVVAHNIAEKINGGNKFRSFDGQGQCFLEMGHGKAGYAGGNFYASPVPIVKLKSPGFIWHWAKLWFEKYWWFKYF